MASYKSILSVDDLSDGDLHRLFCAAHLLKSKGYKKRFDDKVLISAFFEASTRTRLSFEMAAHRLGLRVSTFNQSSSSMQKGESFHETIANILALSPDILVLRSAHKLEDDFTSNSAIINGGDGINEHPSQALLDCFTLLESFGTEDLSGKKILIVGDVFNSRVAHSNIKLMKRLSAQVVLLAPQALRLLCDLGQDHQVSSFSDLDDQFSAVMCLRLQKERMKEGFFTSSDYGEFSLTKSRLLSLGPNCSVLHPGPIADEEISLEVAKGPKSLIYRQVENGVILRSVLIEHCLS